MTVDLTHVICKIMPDVMYTMVSNGGFSFIFIISRCRRSDSPSPLKKHLDGEFDQVKNSVSLLIKSNVCLKDGTRIVLIKNHTSYFSFSLQ